MAWVLGNRDVSTFQRLYDKVKHLTQCIFYTDNWKAYSEVLPKERHISGKKHTIAIEQNNSNTRHHLARFTRKTKVISKKKSMVDLTLKCWSWIAEGPLFKVYQALALSIYR